MVASVTLVGCGGGTTSGAEPEAPTDNDSYGPSDPPTEESTEETTANDATAEGHPKTANESGSTPAAGSSTRTPEMISAFVAEHRGEVRPCVSKEQKSDPTLGGDIVFKLVLTPSGKVRSLEVNRGETTLPSETAITCVADIVRGWQFPASSDDMDTVVNYPFTFNAKKPK